MSERTRKKTNVNEITDQEWIEVNARLAKVQEQLTDLQLKWEKENEIQAMMESYVMQCEKAKQTGKRVDLPKYLQRKLDKQ